MPKFKVQHPDGRMLTIEGDAPPTEAELDEIFAKVPAPAPKTEPGFIERNAPTISAIARPTLEVGGAMAGAAAAGLGALPGGPAAIPAATVGGGLGFAGGRAAADLLDRKLGLKPPLGSVTEAASETARDIQAGAMAEAGGPVLKAAGKATKGIGKAMLSVLFGPSMKDIDARLLNPEAIKNAKPFDLLARELPKDVQALSDEVGARSTKALDTLSTSKYLDDGAQAKDALLAAVKSERDGLGRSISDATLNAKKALVKYAKRVNRLGNTVSENELGQIIRDIDNDVDWGSKSSGPLNNALMGIRHRIDGLLKAGNPAYAEEMKSVAEGVRLLKKAQSVFRIDRQPGQGYMATDTTVTKLRGAAAAKKIDAQDVLDALKEVTGKDYLSAARNAATAEGFVGGKTQGSRMVNLGAGLGAGAGYVLGGHGGAGGVPGAVLGALGGGYVDRHGGEMAGSIIDALVKTSRGVGPLPQTELQRAIAAAVASGATR